MDNAQTVTRPKTTLRFDEQEIDGHAVIPTITYGLVPKVGPFQCMVKVRMNFLPEAQESVSNL